MLFYCQILLNFQSAQALIQVRSLSNYIYEQNYSKAYLKINAADENGVGSWAEGVWSPDSTRNYDVVN